VFTAISANVARVIQGKPEVIELAMLCLVSEGHLLIEDVPGVGKTSMAKALARSIDSSFGRIQFTPDLLPSDVVGVTVWNRSDGLFEFRPGPVFANIVLGDEINRASPKTQSALLEAMAEGQVTVDNVTYPLGPPFMVIATQNPIEHEGTYPLPESHGDHTTLGDISSVASSAQVESLIATARAVHVAPSLKGYLVDLADATRRHPKLALGMSPRATLSLMRVARARAASSGRQYIVPDDLKVLARPVLGHRLLVTAEAQLQGISSSEVLEEILHAVPVPTGLPD
jgi:MoxR-like ATPase